MADNREHYGAGSDYIPCAIVQFALFAVRPLRHAETMGRWVDLGMRLLIVLGILVTTVIGISVETSRWLLTIVTPSLIAILFLIAGVRLQHKLSDWDDLVKIKSGDTIKNKVINASMLFENRNLYMVDNVTFSKCTLKGPCLVALKGHNNFNRSSFWGSQDYTEHLILADDTRTYNGAGIFMHCKFEYCRFENVAWLLNQKYYNKLSKITKARG